MAKRYYKSAKGSGIDSYKNAYAQTKTQDWSCPADSYAMTQEDNGSMGYMARKDRLKSSDAKRLRGQMLSQDGSKY